MAATMSTTAAPPTSRFTPGPDCLKSMFLTVLPVQVPPEEGCLTTGTHYRGCPIYYLGLTDYYNTELSTSCYPTSTVEGCPSGYTTACAKSTVTPPVFNRGLSTLDWPVTKIDAVCCPTNMQFRCTDAGYFASCIAPVTQDTVVGLYTYKYYPKDPPDPITAPSGEIPFLATATFGKQTVTEAATLKAGQDFVWAHAIGVGERVYGTSVAYVDYLHYFGPAPNKVPPPAVRTQQHWAPGGNPRRTGIAALGLVLAVTVLFLSSVFGIWRKRITLKKRREKRDIYTGNWTRGPPGSSGPVRSRTRLTGGTPAFESST